MSPITKEQLITLAQEDVAKWRDAMQHNVNTEYAAIRLRLAEIALASLEVEPVAYVDPFAFNNFRVYRAGDTDNKRMGRAWMWANPDAGLVPVYTAPPAPVSVPDESAVESLATDLMKRIDKITGERHSVATLSSLRVSIVESCRSAMLQGAENTESRCTMQPASALDSLPQNADSRCSNSPVFPDGWVMVPVEPTEEMLAELCLVEGWTERAITSRYKAMIAAAPQQEA